MKDKWWDRKNDENNLFSIQSFDNDLLGHFSRPNKKWLSFASRDRLARSFQSIKLIYKLSYSEDNFEIRLF